MPETARTVPRSRLPGSLTGADATRTVRLRRPMRHGASTFGWMRLLLALLVAMLVVPAGARANDALLWACHGPDGRALPGSYDSVRSAGTFVMPTSGVPCATPGDTIRVGFSDPNPPEGSLAALRLN